MNVMLDDTRDLSYIGVFAGWILIRTVEEAKFYLRGGQVENMSLDHDLGVDENGEYLPTGYDLICWMERTGIWPQGEIFVHSQNPIGAQKMRMVIQKRPTGI